MYKLLTLLATLVWAGLATAQPSEPPATGVPDRAATGGATTLEDIMARQRGEKLDTTYRSSNTGEWDGTGTTNPLGTLGGASDSDVYRSLRYGSADVTVSARGPAADVIIQDRGIGWLQFRAGPLSLWGAYLLGATLLILAIFFLLRGKIRIDGEKTGHTITRFSSFERFGHWLFAGSFILLGLTGLIVLFGRSAIMPLVGAEAFHLIARLSKLMHNNVAWAFMIGLAIIVVNWTLHNIPNRHDLKWLAVAGGLFSKNVHPPARKFNAGQKLIFWACVVFGLVISVTGLALLFPFEIPLFAGIVPVINSIGIPGWFGAAPLPDVLAPHEEMQIAQLVHAIVAFLFIAIILAHIYLGSIGMEGAFDAMGSGEVEEQWAREHHGLWVDEVKAEEAASGGPAPAE